ADATPGRDALRALQARTEAALARAQALEQQLSQLEQARQADQQRLAALEQQVAEERARREEAERSPAQRREALGAAAGELDGAVDALAGGSDEVGASLAQAQALAAEASRHAGQHGSQEEAVQADEAQRWLGVSQEALSRGDLFQARQAAAAASQAARRAGLLAGTAPPAATGSSGSSY
ncbi:MAG TPA: helicase SNF2, partial [Anaeromyxobacteraceae bacterium]